MSDALREKFIYEIARNLAEARDLMTHGCGYETEESAKKALKSPEIDSYYRNQLKIFRLEKNVQGN